MRILFFTYFFYSVVFVNMKHTHTHTHTHTYILLSTFLCNIYICMHVCISYLQLYGHLPPITKTIQLRRNRHPGHCWRSKDELISDVLLWNPTYGRAKAGRPAGTYIQQLCEDTGCNPEDLPEAMNDRGKWRERDIRAGATTWWYIYIYIYIYICVCVCVCVHINVHIYIYIYMMLYDATQIWTKCVPLVVLTFAACLWMEIDMKSVQSAGKLSLWKQDYITIV